MDAYPITDGCTVELKNMSVTIPETRWEPGPSEVKRLAVEELIEHGYDKIDAEQALRQAQGDIGEAVSLLIEE